MKIEVIGKNGFIPSAANREYAEKKYGSADNYWDLENEGKLPEEDRGIQFGYDKTNFKFFIKMQKNSPFFIIPKHVFRKMW